jgi:predicted ribosomally synthesized peptide with SipW-like signal peptide
MTDGNLELTRRGLLGAATALGAAGVGAGLGTGALFSDEESVENNSIQAGTLDLKVDWEEHYAYPQIYGFDDPTAHLDVKRSDPQDETYRPFPPGIEEADAAAGGPLLWVKEGDVPAYMNNTALDAFPDPDDDGAQETEVTGGGGPFAGEEPTVYDPCLDGADLDENLDPDGLRTDNDDTNDNGPAPLINLSDVKPGDFGEVTLSTHLCGNDGYLWLQGDLVEASENGVMEPEADDPDEDQHEDGSLKDSDTDDEKTVELLDRTRTAFWYDNNGDNLVKPDVDELDLMVVVDRSNSIEPDEQDDLVTAANTFAEAVRDQADVFGSPPAVQVGLLTFGGDISRVEIKEPLGSAEPFFDDSGDPLDEAPAALGDYLNDGTGFNGNTPMAGALSAAQEHLVEGNTGNKAPNARPDAAKAILLVTDGGPTYVGPGFDGNEYGVDVDDDGDLEAVPRPDGSGFSGGGATGVVTQHELDETEQVAESIRASGTEIFAVGILTDDEAEAGNDESNLVSGADPANLNTYLRERIASTPGRYFNTEFDGDLERAAELVGEQITTGDEVFFTGTLREALEKLSSDGGVPLDGSGDTTDFNEFANDAAGSSDREPFDASTTDYVGFSWWLPADVGNEVQSDSVAFDLGFYAQQARNNDGGYQP